MTWKITLTLDGALPDDVEICGTLSLTLSTEHVWPDDDGPTNPTAADVQIEMRSSAATPADLVASWNLGGASLQNVRLPVTAIAVDGQRVTF